MTIEEQKENFLKLIEADPYDFHTRKVYADFLDEFGSDKDFEIAERERNWTIEKQDAKEFLQEIVGKLNSEYQTMKNPYTNIEKIIEHVKDAYLLQDDFDDVPSLKNNQDMIIDCVETII